MPPFSAPAPAFIASRHHITSGTTYHIIVEIQHTDMIVIGSLSTLLPLTSG